MNQILKQESLEKLFYLSQYSRNDWKGKEVGEAPSLEDATTVLLLTTGNNIKKLSNHYKKLEKQIETFETLLNKKVYIDVRGSGYGDVERPRVKTLTDEEFAEVAALKAAVVKHVKVEEILKEMNTEEEVAL